MNDKSFHAERMRRGRGLTLWRFSVPGASHRLYFAREAAGNWRQVDELAADYLAIRCDWTPGDGAHLGVWRKMLEANAEDPEVMSALALLLERAWDEVRDLGFFPISEALSAEDRVVIAALHGVTASRRVDLNRDWDDRSRWVSNKIPMLCLRDTRLQHCLLLYALTFNLAHNSVGVEGVPDARLSPELYRTLSRAKEGHLRNVYRFVPAEAWHGDPVEGLIYWDYRAAGYISVGRQAYEHAGRTWYRPLLRPLETPET